MDMTELGLPTHHTRVERWECDYNNHWNTRFYLRSFQQAREAALQLTTSESPATTAAVRHIRFHRELFASAPVEVRSSVLDGGAFDGAIVHLLSSSGRLAATALDMPGDVARGFPRVTPEEVAPALPRGLEGTAHEAVAGALGDEATVVLGPVARRRREYSRPSACGHARWCRISTVWRPSVGAPLVSRKWAPGADQDQAAFSTALSPWMMPRMSDSFMIR